MSSCRRRSGAEHLAACRLSRGIGNGSRFPCPTGSAFAPVSANWVFVALDVVAAAGLLIRVPREEQMMLEEFKDDYRADMGRTGRFFPKRHAS